MYDMMNKYRLDMILVYLSMMYIELVDGFPINIHSHVSYQRVMDMILAWCISNVYDVYPMIEPWNSEMAWGEEPSTMAIEVSNMDQHHF